MSVPQKMRSTLAQLLFLVLLTQVPVNVKGRKCPDTWFKCGDDQCIAGMWVCDGHSDCLNSEDEKNCDTDPKKGVKCMSSQFQCDNSNCIPMKWRCDGEHDCTDNSDEKNCENITSCDGFRCHDNHCIPTRWKCDGQSDCSDGSDEFFCPNSNSHCGEEFKCSSGSCVNMSKVCDGKPDCIDGSDEGIKCSNLCSNASCEHDCHATPSGMQCLCRAGYELNSDNKTCSDVNECKEVGVCSHTCTNLPGSYECSCLDGYEVVDGICMATGDEPLLVFTTPKDIRAYKVRSKIYFPIHNAVSRSTAVDVDPTESTVYWTEISRNGSSIYACNLDGTDFRAVVDHGLLVPEDVAVDYTAKNLYVTDSGLKQVLVCKTDGSTCHVLHKNGVDKPRALALDISESLVYWSDWGDKPGIYKSYMDGTGRTTLVSTNVKWPNGIAIDHTTNRLYWCDARLYRIEYISLDGTNRKVLLQETIYHPYSMAVFEDTLYWTDWSTFSVDTCNKFTGHKQNLIARENGKHVMGIHVYHPVLSRHTRNPCWTSLCSHMCLIGARGEYRCACPPGFTLSGDVSCTLSPDSAQIFVTADSSIYHVQPESAGNKLVTKLPILNFEPISDLSYNWNRKVFYISTLKSGEILEVNLTTLSKRELLKRHIDVAENLAYDWLGENLYWTDPGKGTVEVLSLKTMSRMVLISNLTETTDLVLVPENGLIFISVIGSYPHVAVYDMDGSNRKEIAPVTGTPTCIAVHPTHPLLYWYDRSTEIIFSVNHMKPSNSKKIQRRDVPNVSSIAVSERFIYWLESTSNKLNMMHTDDNRSIFHSTNMLEDFTRPSIRKITYFVPKKATSACARKNGGCSHICLVKPSGRTCRCPAGWRIGNDGTTCEVEKICSLSEFRCVKSGKCVPLDYRCDRTPDCDDGSDEDDCAASPTRCPDGDFQCRNGRCILNTWKCDSRNDCGDNSDEEGCPIDISCAPDKFSCLNGQCIPALWRCDGESDCSNGQDEKNCTITKCEKNEFRCDHGQCIPNSWVCDDSKDCLDGTDESPEDCKVVAAQSCPKDSFHCDDGTCIDSILVCDRRSDCEDNSDERDCGPSSKTTVDCKIGMFQCDDGKCIYIHEVCDGYHDCSNDESQNCTKKECTDSEFYCSSTKRCIPRLWLCDGDPDCKDGADENLNMCSQKPTIPASERAMEISFRCQEFTCNNRDCLPWSKVCDGKTDCSDKSDEGVACVTSCGKTNGGCTHLCSPTPRGPRCSCIGGYELLNDNKTCDDVNECENYGVCSQFCNNTKGGFKCSCAVGYFLSHDHRTCKADGGAANLVYLLPDQIRGIELSSKYTRVYYEEDQTDMRGLDFDAASGVFFYSEWKEGTINRYNIGSRRNEVLLKGLLRPYYLRWDWLAKNIYYTSGDGSINACTAQGEFCTKVVESAAPHINSLELAPQNGVLFWSVWSDVVKKSNGHIERSNMDGTDRVIILSEKVYWPCSLTVDNVVQMLYWADVKLNVVEMADFHGLKRRVVIDNGMYNPFSMTMFEDHIYWADWGTDRLMRCNKFTGTSDCEQVQKNNIKSESIVVVHKVKQPRGIDPCANSGCPQICLQSPVGFSCHCDRMFDLKNGSCVRKPVPEMIMSQPPTCSPDYCKNGGECYPVGPELRCRCPYETDGLQCEVKTGGGVYDYTWVFDLFLGVSSIGIFVLVIIYCRQNKSKIAKLKDSMAVTFRNPRFAFRKRGGLVMDTDDDGADVDELMLGKKGAYTPSAFGNPLFGQRPFTGASPVEGDYKRWPSYDSDDSAFVSECQTRDDTSLNNLSMEQPSTISKDTVVQFLKKI